MHNKLRCLPSMALQYEGPLQFSEWRDKLHCCFPTGPLVEVAFCNLGPSLYIAADRGSRIQHRGPFKYSKGFMGQTKHRLALWGSPRQNLSRGHKFDFMRGNSLRPEKQNFHLKQSMIISSLFLLAFLFFNLFFFTLLVTHKTSLQATLYT